jgi:hypothetical protein
MSEGRSAGWGRYWQWSGAFPNNTLPIDACVELTRRLLTAAPTLPSGAARSRAVVKIVVLFVAEYGITA